MPCAAPLEGALRAASLALIAVPALQQERAGRAPGGGTEVVPSASLARGSLAIEFGSQRREKLVVDFVDKARPRPRDRDALMADPHAGTRVTWSGAGDASGCGGRRARASAGRSGSQPRWASAADVALFDGLAALDTVRLGSASRGATIGVGVPSGALGVRSGSARAPVGVPRGDHDASGAYRRTRRMGGEVRRRRAGGAGMECG